MRRATRTCVEVDVADLYIHLRTHAIPDVQNAFGDAECVCSRTHLATETDENLNGMCVCARRTIVARECASSLLVGFVKDLCVSLSGRFFVCLF